MEDECLTFFFLNEVSVFTAAAYAALMEEKKRSEGGIEKGEEEEKKREKEGGPSTSKQDSIILDKDLAEKMKHVGKEGTASVDEIVAMHMQLNEFMGRSKV